MAVEATVGQENSVVWVACREDGKCPSGRPRQRRQVKCSLCMPDGGRRERSEPQMKLMDRAELARGTPGKVEAVGLPTGAQATMETQTYCAYNQTRECFLGLNVKVGDLPSTHVAELMLEKPLKSGEGVWMKPFRGIAATAMPAPLDLIYLDDECRVIDMAESFPTFQVSSSSPRPESVLALPAHSIYSSQTQAGDQLVLCVAEEMERRLERLESSHSEPVQVASFAGAALLREKPLWSGGPGVLELESRVETGENGVKETHQMDLAPPSKRAVKQPRNWFERWWSPDPRRAPRVPGSGLAAYYWNGD